MRVRTMMRHRWLRWVSTLAVIAAISAGCATKNGGGNVPAPARREAEEVKAQARQGLVDFQREKPRPPAREIGDPTGRQLTVLAASERVQRARRPRAPRTLG